MTSKLQHTMKNKILNTQIFLFGLYMFLRQEIKHLKTKISIAIFGTDSWTEKRIRNKQLFCAGVLEDVGARSYKSTQQSIRETK